MKLKVAVAPISNGYIAKCLDLIDCEYIGKTKEESVEGIYRLIHGLFGDERYRFQIDNCQKGKSILNVGCDEDPVMLKYRFGAVNFDIYNHEKGTVDIVGDIRNMPFPDNSFDIVVAGDILEHIPDYMKAISELRRVYKEKLVITVPTIDYEIKIGHRIGKEYQHRISHARHVWKPTYEEVKSIFPTAEYHEFKHWLGCFIVETKTEEK